MKIVNYYKLKAQNCNTAVSLAASELNNKGRAKLFQI